MSVARQVLNGSLLDTVSELYSRSPLSLHSRAYRAPWLDSPGLEFFVKRDDELGGVFGGSKVRKYVSMLSFMVQGNCNVAALLGSLRSNNVYACGAYLLENNITPYAFLRITESKAHMEVYHGLVQMLFGRERASYIERSRWTNVRTIVAKWKSEQVRSGVNVYIIEEGAFVLEAVIGAMTLGIDIIRNEGQLGTEFDHIFVDAGSGMTAICLSLILAAARRSTKVHVCMMYNCDSVFTARLKYVATYLKDAFSCDLLAKINLCTYPPITQSDCGEDPRLRDEIFELASVGGIIAEPMYSGRLFLQARVMAGASLHGKVLIVHSGCGVNLWRHLQLLGSERTTFEKHKRV